MIDDLGGVTSQLVKLALDASVLRHQAISQNIANANTAHYRPVRVNFEEQLDLLKTQLAGRSDDALLKARLQDVHPYLQEDPARQPDEGRGLLDMHMGELARNVVHYQALLKGLSKKTALISLAINEGRK